MERRCVVLNRWFPRDQESYSRSAGSRLRPRHPKRPLPRVFPSAKIYDQKGVIIGFVDKVILDAGGKAVELRVDVGNYLGMGTKMVAMMAGDFKFDTGHKTLITNLTNAQIQVIAGGH
jgi:hypothetical protein